MAEKPSYEEMKQRVNALEKELTEGKLAEKSLLESKTLLKAIMDNAPALVSAKDLKGNVIMTNRRFEVLDGPSPEEFIGKNVYDLFPFEIADALWKNDLAAIEADAPVESEEVVAHKDGEMHTYHTVKFPLYGVEDKAFGTCAISVDITERKQAELKLSDALAHIRLLKGQLEAECVYFQEEIKQEQNFENIIGHSDALKYVLHRVEEVAPTDAPVLIMGETGTGKELIARAIHSTGLRNKRPLIKVNCAALPTNLIESELFGHEKGAFTGADARRVGRFELADGASLFLDEISEIPLELQSKLLQVLQEGEFERLGSSKTLRSDVRIITASNRNLENEVKSGRFREDLLYRINVFPLTVPPLRHRKEDIPLLVNWFVDKFNRKMGKQIESIPSALIEHLQAYEWPGNVRELENVIERAIITTQGAALKLFAKLDPSRANRKTASQPTRLADVEQIHILKILDDTHWKIEGDNGAAKALGLAPSTLRDRMNKLDIHRAIIR